MEAVIIVAAMGDGSSGVPVVNYPDVEPSRHLKEYQETIDRGGDSNSEILSHAGRGHLFRQSLKSPEWRGGYSLGFMEAVHRLELISPSLIDGDEP